MKYLLGLFLCWVPLGSAWAGEWWYSPSVPRDFPLGQSEVCFLVTRDEKTVQVYGYRVGETNAYDEDWVTIPARPKSWWEKMQVHGR